MEGEENPRRKAKKKRKAYPQYAIAKERAIAFNLQLDVNNLKQEIKSHKMLLEILGSKRLAVRHAPSGSLMVMVRQYYAVFQRGFQSVADDGAHRRADQIDQREFLACMMDEQVDCEHGFVGYDFIIEQFRLLTSRFAHIHIEMQYFDIIDTDEFVLIHTRGVFRARIIDQTLVEIFPHIRRHPRLVYQLLGKELECPYSTIFTFNNEGKVYRFRVEIDFVVGLSVLLEDLEDVAIMMDRARLLHSSVLLEDSITDSYYFDIDTFHGLPQLTVAPSTRLENVYQDDSYQDSKMDDEVIYQF